MGTLQIWRATDAGRKFSKSPVPSRRNDVLDYLYTSRRGTLSEISMATGKPEPVVRAELRKLKADGLVRCYSDVR